MDTRLTVPLDWAEKEALHRAAAADLRPLRDQARWLIRQGLVQNGYLEPEDGAGREHDLGGGEVKHD